MLVEDAAKAAQKKSAYLFMLCVTPQEKSGAMIAGPAGGAQINQGFEQRGDA
jgi:hypothetical protein